MLNFFKKLKTTNKSNPHKGKFLFWNNCYVGGDAADAKSSVTDCNLSTNTLLFVRHIAYGVCIVCYCYQLLCTAGRYGEHKRRELCPSSTIYLYRRAHGHCPGTTYTAFGVNKAPGALGYTRSLLLCSFCHNTVKNAECLLHVGTLPFFQLWIITSRTLNVAQPHMKFSIVAPAVVHWNLSLNKFATSTPNVILADTRTIFSRSYIPALISQSFFW